MRSVNHDLRDELVPAALVGLTHHRWLIPVLAECDTGVGGGCKYVTFLTRLGLSRDSLGRTLAAGIEAGWLKNAVGAGHPLRPEYLLTPRGRELSAHARRVRAELRKLDLEDVGLNKWSLPVLCAVGLSRQKGTRFSEVGRLLPAGTGRAISLALKELEEAALVVRRVEGGYPPVAMYGVQKRARRLLAAARALARAAGVKLAGPRREGGGQAKTRGVIGA